MALWLAYEVKAAIIYFGCSLSHDIYILVMFGPVWLYGVTNLPILIASASTCSAEVIGLAFVVIVYIWALQNDKGRS